MEINKRISEKFLKPFKSLLLITLVAIVFYPSSISALYANSLTVSGNKIVKNDSSQFIPYGISIYGGLEDIDYRDNLANIDAQIKAAVYYWHTNTIRLQVSEDNLFLNINKKIGYNQGFMNELIREVNLARNLNQVVVINDQTEFTSNTPNPTQKTVRFWRIVSTEFANQSNVIFDLFNEPRLDNLRSINSKSVHGLMIGNLPINRTLYRSFVHPKKTIKKTVWQIWKYGGKIDKTEYIGMQDLVNEIRGWHVNNIIWIESPYWAQRLPGARFVISGNNIVYSYHHINLNRPSSWSFIGKFASNHAVVDGEWAQYQSPWQECFIKAPQETPDYLNYLEFHGIGLIAWSLQPGSLVFGNNSVVPNNTNSVSDTTNPALLAKPSVFSSDYDCNNQFGQGAGQLIQQYFLKYSEVY